jgi:hypothetical protein
VSLVGKSPSGHFRRGPLPCGEQVGGSSCFHSWEHLGNNLPTEGQAKAFPRGNRTAGIMAFLEQRPRGDGGITARVIWRQDGQRAAEKFAPNSRHSPF